MFNPFSFIINIFKKHPVSPLPSPVPPGNFVIDVVNLINNQRQSSGLAPLALNVDLNASAQFAASDMAKTGVMSHTTSDGETVGQRMIRFGFTYGYAGECIAEGTTDPNSVVQLWLNDKPHRDIVMSVDYNFIGVGEANSFWVADFASQQGE